MSAFADMTKREYRHSHVCPRSTGIGENLNHPLLTYKLFYKFLGVAGFDEVFAEHLL